MKMIDIIEEQVFNKWKEKLANVGQNIQNGVHNVAQKVADVTQKQPTQQTTQQPQPQKQGRTLEETRAEWSKVNSDMTNKRGFGEAVGQTESAALMQSHFKARASILKKLGQSQASFGTTIVDEATFKLPNGNIDHLCILEMTEQ
jgi:monomeric isocitrate dehydrogenase